MTERELIEHFKVSPIEMVFRPFWKKILISPVLIYKHYHISHQGGLSLWLALKMACNLNYALLFCEANYSIKIFRKILKHDRYRY